jgi:protein-disulfide isomerase
MSATAAPSLKPPVGPQDHIQGPHDAPVQLVEFGDYECPYCREAYPVVKALQERLGDQMCFVFRNFPLAQAHPHAEEAAEAAEAAASQSKFWPMHDMLYENQDTLEPEDLVQYARALHLDLPRFVREMGDHLYAERVREDFRSGVRSGVNGTPTFFINGVRHNGPFDLVSLLAAIEEAV